MDLPDWYRLLRAAAVREEGQTMAEYGVVLALICLAVVAALGALGLAFAGKLGTVTNALTSALPGN
jgi:Flp pilus assembly pilin Flp